MYKNDISKTLEMETLGMKGPFDLSKVKINEAIEGKSPGNYALGYISEHAFIVKYIGRSDDDLNNSLKSWVGKYPKFKWSYARSAKEAYEKELQNFHDFGGLKLLDNKHEPVKPKEGKMGSSGNSEKPK
jgi:hypothetical protein